MRAKEQRLQRRLTSLAEKEAIRQDYLEAIEVITDCDLEQSLFRMMEDTPTLFKRILDLIIEPQSCKVQAEGRGPHWTSKLIDYKIKSELKEFLSEHRTLSKASTNSGVIYEYGVPGP